MNKIIIGSLILITFNSNQGLSNTVRIPVIPYNKISTSVTNKIHNKCKSVVNYSNCVKRYLRTYE